MTCLLLPLFPSLLSVNYFHINPEEWIACLVDCMTKANLQFTTGVPFIWHWDGRSLLLVTGGLSTMHREGHSSFETGKKSLKWNLFNKAFNPVCNFHQHMKCSSKQASLGIFFFQSEYSLLWSHYIYLISVVFTCHNPQCCYILTSSPFPLVCTSVYFSVCVSYMFPSEHFQVYSFWAVHPAISYL